MTVARRLPTDVQNFVSKTILSCHEEYERARSRSAKSYWLERRDEGLALLRLSWGAFTARIFSDDSSARNIFDGNPPRP